MKSKSIFAASLLALLVAVVGSETTAEEKLNLNIVTYQPPAGLIAYINERAPQGVTYNQNGYASISEANIVIYFMSGFENRYEITEFGSDILDAGGEIGEEHFLIQRSVQHRDRIVYMLYVATGQLDGSEEEIKCHTNNGIAAVTSNFVHDLPLRIQQC